MKKSLESNYFETRYGYLLSAGNAAAAGLNARRLMSLIEKFHGPVQSLIDLGSGTGDLAGAVHAQFHLRIAGIDQDRRMVEKANQKEIGRFFPGSILFPLPDLEHQFDAVSSFEVFEHLTPDQHKDALASYRHYGAKGSVGVVMVPNAANPLVGGLLAWSDYTHRTGFTAESLAQMLRENGFRKIKVVPWFIAGRWGVLVCRRMAGFVLGGIHKFISSLIASFPRPADPAVSDPIPFSSHLIAVFEINEAP